MRLHAFLKQSRLDLQLSSKELSIRARLDPSLVTRYEKGERLPTRIHLEQIAESLKLDFKACLQLWLSEQVERVFEQEDAGTRNEVLSLLLGGSAKLESSDDRLLQKLIHQLQRFDKCKQLYAEEWLSYKETQQLRAFHKLCTLLELDFDSEELRQILLDGQTVSRHNLQSHLVLHQLYQAWVLASSQPSKAVLTGLAWFQQYYPGLGFANPKNYKTWSKHKEQSESLNAFLAWHKQTADSPIRLYLDAVFMMAKDWPLLYESFDSSDENSLMQELNKRLLRAIEAMES